MLKPFTLAQRIVLGALVAIILGSASWIAYQRQRPLRPAPYSPAETAPVPPIPGILVEVSGAVARPGLYEMPSGSRVYEALEAAGGFTAEADRDAVKLAPRLKDGDRIVVPVLRPPRLHTRSVPAPPRPVAPVSPPAHALTAPRQATEFTPTSVEAKSSVLPLSLNSASLEQLTALPGVDAETAKRIVAYRQQHPFRQVEELLLIKGITPQELVKLRPLLVP